jgi:hypothetical protein
VQIKTPDQFKWRNPSMQPPNNAVLLGGLRYHVQEYNRAGSTPVSC